MKGDGISVKQGNEQTINGIRRGEDDDEDVHEMGDC